jgi:hypothetical protein
MTERRISLHEAALQANSAAPASVNLTYVPLSCIHSHPRSIASLRPALYSAGLPFNFDRKGQLIFSMWMRPSCTGSTELAISISFCATTSVSAKGRAAGDHGLAIDQE